MVVKPHFEEPPVREVNLTVYFKWVATLQALNLAQLRIDWKNPYPKVSEVPPLRPTDGRAFAKYLSENSFWPMPLTTFTNARGDRSVELQNDRFGIVWRFDEGPKAYPGYDDLAAELRDRFSQFREELKSNLTEDVEPVCVSISYQNLIEGYAPEAVAAGVLTGWNFGEGVVASPQSLGLHLDFQSPSEDSSVDIQVDIGTDNVDDPDIDKPCCALDISATVQLSSRDALNAALEKAHDLITDKFLGIINDDMRRRWRWRDGPV